MVLVVLQSPLGSSNHPHEPQGWRRNEHLLKGGNRGASVPPKSLISSPLAPPSRWRQEVEVNFKKGTNRYLLFYNNISEHLCSSVKWEQQWLLPRGKGAQPGPDQGKGCTQGRAGALGLKEAPELVDSGLQSGPCLHLPLWPQASRGLSSFI